MARPDNDGRPASGAWRHWRWMLAILLVILLYNALAILTNLYVAPGAFRWY